MEPTANVTDERGNVEEKQRNQRSDSAPKWELVERQLAVVVSMTFFYFYGDFNAITTSNGGVRLAAHLPPIDSRAGAQMDTD